MTTVLNSVDLHPSEFHPSELHPSEVHPFGPEFGPTEPAPPPVDAAGQTKLYRAELPADGAEVHVRVRVELDRELPDLVLWRDRLWVVREIIDHAVAEPGPHAPPGSLAEHVWWVVAAAGQRGGEHVFVLGQSYPGGQWRLHSVLGELSAACG